MYTNRSGGVPCSRFAVSRTCRYIVPSGDTSESSAAADETAAGDSGVKSPTARTAARASGPRIRRRAMVPPLGSLHCDASSGSPRSVRTGEPGLQSPVVAPVVVRAAGALPERRFGAVRARLVVAAALEFRGLVLLGDPPGGLVVGVHVALAVAQGLGALVVGVAQVDGHLG